VESTNLAWKGSTANLLLQKLAARSSDEVLEEVLQGEQLLIHNMKKEYVRDLSRALPHLEGLISPSEYDPATFTYE
jgi:hypothetical protein